jgi:SepF-like predicted cell division protein (DUF552 family)
MQTIEETQQERGLPTSMREVSTTAKINQGWDNFLDENKINDTSIANGYYNQFSEVHKHLINYNELDVLERIGKEALPEAVEKKLKLLAENIKAAIAEKEANQEAKINSRAEGIAKGLKLVETSKLSDKLAELRMIFKELREIEREHNVNLVNIHEGRVLTRGLNFDDSLLFIQDKEWRCNL